MRVYLHKQIFTEAKEVKVDGGGTGRGLGRGGHRCEASGQLNSSR